MELKVTKRNGLLEPLDIRKIQSHVAWACEGLDVSQSEVELGAKIQFYNEIQSSEIHKALILSASRLISEKKPDYSYVASRLLLQQIFKEVNGGGIKYPSLTDYVDTGVRLGRISPKLQEFDLEYLNSFIDESRDFKFTYLGLSTVYDRYLLRDNPDRDQAKGIVFEMPQHFFMRVAMGLSINEKDKEESAVEFYNLLSSFDYMASTPTLFNSGTLHSQMSSCYGNTVADDLVKKGGIYDKLTECAALSKFAGGIGTDWNSVRGSGSHIQSTNGQSSGIVPFLKVFNDTSVAVNQGGKRKGAFAAYIEPWHADVMEFIDLKRKAGDERRRCHDIFPALWVNDLFFERKNNNAKWTLFCPSDVPHLHELYGEEFKQAYEQAERDGLGLREVDAMELWKKILTSLNDTGAPWITFKDESNRRNPQQHDGVVHNSNLCTEIILNNKADETFVCNLGSINMANHIDIEAKEVDLPKLENTVKTAIRMLDNVIDINFYPSEDSKRSNLKHRPIGLGMMGYSEALAMLDIDYESNQAVMASDIFGEIICFNAIEASCDLAAERGSYESFAGSLWSQGILPKDNYKQMDFKADIIERGVYSDEDWAELREKVIDYGMRNCNLIAIAPTATISNIVGTTPCIELPIEPSYDKENLGGKYKVFDVRLRYADSEKLKYAYDVDQMWTIKQAAVRQKWIDQSQSLNLFKSADVKGRTLDEWYTKANQMGIKTTYYLRTQKANANMAKAAEK